MTNLIKLTLQSLFITFITVLLIINKVHADTKSPRDWVSLNSVLENINKGDKAQTSYVYARCGGLMLGISLAFQARADSKSLEEQFKRYGELFMMAYIARQELTAGFDGKDPEFPARSSGYTETVRTFVNSYTDVMQENWVQLGSFFVGDAFMESEITICTNIAKAVQG